MPSFKAVIFPILTEELVTQKTLCAQRRKIAFTDYQLQNLLPPTHREMQLTDQKEILTIEINYSPVLQHKC